MSSKKPKLFLEYPLGFLHKAKYWIYPMPCHFEYHEIGNYVFAKVSAKGEWIPVYVGEGPLHMAANFNKEAEEAAIRDANYFMAHLNPDDIKRKEECLALIKKLPIVMAPKGMNTPEDIDLLKADIKRLKKDKRTKFFFPNS